MLQIIHLVVEEERLGFLNLDQITVAMSLQKCKVTYNMRVFK